MAETAAASAPSVPPAPSTTETENTLQENGSKMVDKQAGGHKPESTEEGAGQASQADAPKTNGEASHTAIDASDRPSSPTQDSKDTEMKDAGEAGEAVTTAPSSTAPPLNGTPSVAKRASMGGSSKKKSSAVPEHKSKKLNKKKSKPLTNLDAKPGQYYIARMKGHPPWPSIICDEEMLPPSLLNTRPVTAKLPDGSFKKPEYADGGKRAYERTFPIMFLHTNEFAWIPNTELAVLDVESDAVKNPIEKGKSKPLLAAYAKAAENNDIEHFKAMLAEHQKALEADLEEREERAAKKASKKSRKSVDAAALADDVDDMDIDEEVPAEKPKSKKRKKAEDSEDVEEKPAKTPKTTTKLKLSTPKTPAADSSTKKAAAKPKSAKAAKAAKSASDEEAVTPKVEEKPLTPQQAKEVKEKKVLYYRHKLQRGFLSRDIPPKEDEMKSMSDFLAELETYPDLESSIIRVTKIHKVLKAMLKLPTIPLDGQYKFKDRAAELLGKWNEILASDTAGHSGDKDGDKDEDAKPETEPGDEVGSAVAATTNGDAKSTEEQAEKAEAGAAIAPEEETSKQLENKIGTTVEGEKEAEKPEGTDTVPEKTAEEKKTDGPAIESAPAQEYKPEQTVEAAT